MAMTNDPEAQQHNTMQEGGEVGKDQGGVIQKAGGVGDGDANPACSTEERKPTAEEMREEIENFFETLIFVIGLPLVVGIPDCGVDYRFVEEGEAANITVKSSDFCQQLLAQADLYLPQIANQLYGLASTSGKGRERPIASLPPEAAANTTYTVFLKSSTNGGSRLSPIAKAFSAGVFLVIIYGLVKLWFKLRKLWFKLRKFR
ncbi:hypothetical protein FGG08_005340 [Glutinoglossum americanum]|uniref:Uncharacterized protein n=1 Tax=Glutinoglossum americanum TaxID=1670608 RepID=A0A9P8I5L9_9PEZI|nr:hypothetical protein FGG08_005340 [Glutinoglossum americanum]